MRLHPRILDPILAARRQIPFPGQAIGVKGALGQDETLHIAIYGIGSTHNRIVCSWAGRVHNSSQICLPLRNLQPLRNSTSQSKPPIISKEVLNSKTITINQNPNESIEFDTGLRSTSVLAQTATKPVAAVL